MQVLSLRRRYWHIWTKKGVEYTDFGIQAGEKVDYPDKAKEVCEKVASGEYEMGILICGTGIGMSMSANKIRE